MSRAEGAILCATAHSFPTIDPPLGRWYELPIVTPKLRLLYAEDDPDTRDLITVALKIEGFDVVCPENWKDFLRLARDETWHLFMLDTWMPEIDGFDLCNQIRKFDLHTPIVFYSGAMCELDKKRAFDCGAAAYFTKPIAFDELVAGLKSVVVPPAATTVVP